MEFLKKNIMFLSILLLFISCNDMIDGNPYKIKKDFIQSCKNDDDCSDKAYCDKEKKKCADPCYEKDCGKDIKCSGENHEANCGDCHSGWHKVKVEDNILFNGKCFNSQGESDKDGSYAKHCTSTYLCDQDSECKNTKTLKSKDINICLNKCDNRCDEECSVVNTRPICYPFCEKGICDKYCDKDDDCKSSDYICRVNTCMEICNDKKPCNNNEVCFEITDKNEENKKSICIEKCGKNSTCDEINYTCNETTGICERKHCDNDNSCVSKNYICDTNKNVCVIKKCTTDNSCENEDYICDTNKNICFKKYCDENNPCESENYICDTNICFKKEE